MAKIIGISEEDLEAVRAICPRAAEVLDIISGTPEIKMFVSLSKIVNRMCDELDTIADRPAEVDESGNQQNAIIETHKDDKVFERINLIVKNFSDYSTAFKAGRDSMSLINLTKEDKKKDRKDFFGSNKQEK